jgi:hypothetical protein
MPFSWRAIILSPMLAPALAGLAGAWLFGQFGLFPFIFFFVAGCFVSYGATIFLLLPSLCLVSRKTRPTLTLTAAIGAALGVACILPILLMEWKSSGSDSGPPEESFFSFAARFWEDPLLLMFPVAGFVTAIAYWLLCYKTPARPSENPPAIA